VKQGKYCKKETDEQMRGTIKGRIGRKKEGQKEKEKDVRRRLGMMNG
jgi:hypothetical protein